MNIHLAQSIQARNELARIANVKYQIIGSKDSNPIIGCVQDSLSGAYMMSMDENINYGLAANLLCNTSSTTKQKLIKNKDITGKQLFSHIIPEGINSVKKKGKDIIFQIKDGELTEGMLDKSQLSTTKNSIIHYVWDKYGPTHTQKFIDDTQRLVLNYLLNAGLTVGLNDCIIPDNITKQVYEIIHTKIISANHTLTQYENDYDKITPEIGDSLLSMELNTVSSNIGKMITDVLDKHNGFNIMMSSKAKGNTLNITQIAGCLGQVAIEGQRIKKRIAGRTLPIFHQNDDTPAARGFVKSSFLDGLKGHEFFFHTMGGREGLIDTAIKSVTWDTPIIIMENDNIKRINIGEWIDNYLDNNKNIVKNYNDRNLELLKLEKLNIKSYIPTTDANGCVSWGEITAITRHDPGDTLYEIITQSGRKVIVTESKALLIWNKDINKFIHMDTPNVKIGDYVPVTKILQNINYNNMIDENERDFKIMNYNTQGKFCEIKENELIISNNYESINDVILDAIIKINIINKDVVMEKYPKVYDLTVPSTLNFGLANGLHVVDTAETGYIQRKCVKFLEDLNVNYEGIVRTANGILVQYLYGDSGIDQQKQTQVKINLINMNNDAIKETFMFSKDEIKEFKLKDFEKDFEEYNEQFYKKMIDMRDKLRKLYFKATGNYKVIDDGFMLPINLLRITQEINSHEGNDLDPIYIVNRIEDLLTNHDDRFITMMKEDSNLLKRDDQSYKFMLRLALYEYLAPRKCLIEYKINKKDFDELIDTIHISLLRALVEPGEMVGVVAAQSIGEPCSQMSVTFDTQITCIFMNKKNNIFQAKTIKIGELCDQIIKENPKVTYNTGHKDSVETELSSLDYEYYIIGVDNKEQTHWNKISHVSRHPVNGDLMKVTTKSGRTVTTTLSHSHLIRRNQTVEPITGSDLKVGMRIPVAKHIDNTFVNNAFDYEYGCKLGKDSIDNIPDYLFTSSNECKRGFINTYFNNNGDFTIPNIISVSNNEQFIKDLSLLLCYFDIFSCIKNNCLSINGKYYTLYAQNIKLENTLNEYENNDYDYINGLSEIVSLCYNKVYNSVLNEIYEPISRNKLVEYINIFENHINSKLIKDELDILKQAANSNVIWDEIIDINIYTPDQNDYVYDFTVPGNQTFMVDTGIIVHNTLNTKHFAGVASKGSSNSGVPRIKEIMSFSKDIKTPQMHIYFEDKYATNKSDTNLITSYFKHLTIRELIDAAEIFYNIDTNDSLSKVLDNDKTSNPFYINNEKENNIKSLPFVIRLQMNLEKMMEKETTLLDIKTKFITYWYKNFSNLKNVKKSHKDILVNVDKLAILSNTDNIIHIRFRLNDFNYSLLTSFLNIILDVITLKGIDNIDSVVQLQERRIIFNDNGDALVEKEHIVITDGINLNGMRMIKGINHTRTKINDILTVYQNYGVEAARSIIINELINTFEQGGAGTVNHAHISLLVDMMTYSGEIISIDRHGMNKVDNDPISKASFEKTMDHFINAAIFSETDKMTSVSSRIALGRVIPGGTGAFDLLLDTDKLINSEYIDNETGGRTNFIPLSIEPLFGDIIKYGFAKYDFFVPK